MNPEIEQAIVLIWPAISLLANLWMFFYLRRLEEEKASEARITALEKGMGERHAEHAERITALERTASGDDVKAIYQRLDDLSQALASLSGEFKGASHALAMIQSYLLHGGKS